jgi:DDE superfamily endonuclease
VIDETCHIGFLSATYEGKVNDKTLADLEGYTLPHGSCLYQDMGFQGFILTGSTIVQPKKKPRGGELTPSEQATNRAISSISIRIEHAIGGVKRYRMVKDKIRLLKDSHRCPLKPLPLNDGGWCGVAPQGDVSSRGADPRRRAGDASWGLFPNG